jgi:tripartite-type tricarboxylate transporter receptor subunit TctC
MHQAASLLPLGSERNVESKLVGLAVRALILAGLVQGAAALAQTYPARPVQLVIPFPPGGATDIAGRLIGKKLGDALGQTVVIDNKAGAGTVIGAAFVAGAPADGYTLFISSGSTFTVNPAINHKLPYDPVKSFEPIGMVARVPLILIANRTVPVGDLAQLSAAVRSAPDRFVYGSFGNGTTGHFAAEQLWQTIGIKLTHVPYKGSAPAMADLVGGQIPLAIDTVASALPQLQAGKIKAIAVTGTSRSDRLPAVPTVAEQGYAGFSADSWLPVFAPRGLAVDVRTRLQKTLASVMADPEIADKLRASGLQPAYESATEVATRIEVELPRMRATAARAKIQGD